MWVCPNCSNLSSDLCRQPLCQGCPLTAISNIAVALPLLRWLTKGQKPRGTDPDTLLVVKLWESCLALLNLYFLICKTSMAVPVLLPSQRWLSVERSGSVTLSIISVLAATTPPQAQPRRSTTCKVSSGSRLGRYGRAASLPETSVNNRITESYHEGARGGGAPDFSVSALWVHLGVTIGLCTLIPWSGYHAAVPRLGGLSIPFPRRRPSMPRCFRRPPNPSTCASHTLRTPAFPCANPQGIVQTLFLSRPSLSPQFLCLLSRGLPASFLTFNKYFLSTNKTPGSALEEQDAHLHRESLQCAGGWKQAEQQLHYK